MNINKSSEFFEIINTVKRILPFLLSIHGKQLFPLLAIVADNNDPQGLRRIRVYDPLTGGANHLSEWIFPLRLTHSTDTMVPNEGMTVVLNYINGDPRMPQYSMYHNNQNPSKGKENPINDHWESIIGNHTEEMGGNKAKIVEGNETTTIKKSKTDRVDSNLSLSVGQQITINTDSGSITVSGNGQVTLASTSTVKISAPSIELSGKSTIDGKEICVFPGARDNENKLLKASGQ